LQSHIVFGHDADHDGLDNNTNVNIIYMKTDGIAKQIQTTTKLYVFLHLMLKNEWKSDKEWLQENVLKINGFIWNI
jgi:hypothetical protein